LTAFFYNHVSSQEEEQYVAKFLKILESLEENALSYLFQKGVFQGNAKFQSYEQRLSKNDFRDSLVQNLLRQGDKAAKDADLLNQAAVLLLTLCKEASRMYLDTASAPQRSSNRCAVIALGYHLALIDRITASLNLPSINDKSFWRLLSVKSPPPTQSPAKPAPVTKSNTSVSSPPPRPPQPPARVATPAPSASQQKSMPKENARRQAPQTDDVKASVPSAQQTAVKKPKKAPTKIVNTAIKDKPQENSSAAKPEGPIKAMLRRIVREIRDDSYDAVLNALKDEALMSDLYKTEDDPITVRIVEVNSTERQVHLVKQKMGETEPVTFRLIRKLLTEL